MRSFRTVEVSSYATQEFRFGAFRGFPQRTIDQQEVSGKESVTRGSRRRAAREASPRTGSDEVPAKPVSSTPYENNINQHKYTNKYRKHTQKTTTPPPVQGARSSDSFLAWSNSPKRISAKQGGRSVSPIHLALPGLQRTEAVFKRKHG